MAPPSIEYGTFELLYELPMSAISGGVGLGAGVGRGREVGRGPLFAVTAPTARMRTANAAQINSVIVFIWGFIFFYGFASSYGRGAGVSGIGKISAATWFLRVAFLRTSKRTPFCSIAMILRCFFLSLFLYGIHRAKFSKIFPKLERLWVCPGGN